MLCNKLVFSFTYEAFLFGNRIENFCYAHATRMRGLYVGGTGGLLHVHCMLPENYFCLVDIIYVWFYPPVVQISQLMSSGDNLKFLPHSFPAPGTSYAMPVLILTSWSVSFFVWCSPIGFVQFITKNNSLEHYRICWDMPSCHSVFGSWHFEATQWSDLWGSKFPRRWATMLSWNMGNQILSDIFHIPK
jgi:hypothetical protein